MSTLSDLDEKGEYAELNRSVKDRKEWKELKTAGSLQITLKQTRRDSTSARVNNLYLYRPHNFFTFLWIAQTCGSACCSVLRIPVNAALDRSDQLDHISECDKQKNFTHAYHVKTMTSDMGNHLATTDMGQKRGGVVLFSGEGVYGLGQSLPPYQLAS